MVTFVSKNDRYHIECGIHANLTINIEDEAGVNPDEQHLVRRLKAGERVLTKVRQEKNNL